MDLFISFILSSSSYYYYVVLLFDYLLKSGWRVSVWNFNNQPFKRHLFSVMIYIGISPTITCFSFHIAYVLSFAIKIVYIFLWWLHVINKVKQLHVTMQHFVLIRCLFTGKKNWNLYSMILVAYKRKTRLWIRLLLNNIGKFWWSVLPNNFLLLPSPSLSDCFVVYGTNALNIWWCQACYLCEFYGVKVFLCLLIRITFVFMVITYNVKMEEMSNGSSCGPPNICKLTISLFQSEAVLLS